MSRYLSLSALLIATTVFGAEPGISRYLIVHGNSMSGSWNESRAEDLRARFGDRFAWFRTGGNEYIVTASSVMDEFDRAMEPQKKVNRMQAGVNREQGRVNEMQARVNEHQHDVNAMQAKVNEHQSAVGHSERRQSEVSAEQEGVNTEQSKVNDMQNKVNEEQHKVNADQDKVNDEQRRVSAEFERRVQEILGSALQSGLATRLR